MQGVEIVGLRLQNLRTEALGLRQPAKLKISNRSIPQLGQIGIFNWRRRWLQSISCAVDDAPDGLAEPQVLAYDKLSWSADDFLTHRSGKIVCSARHLRPTYVVVSDQNADVTEDRPEGAQVAKDRIIFVSCVDIDQFGADSGFV